MASIRHFRRAAYLPREIELPLLPDRVHEIFCEMMNDVAVAFNGRWLEFPKTNGVNSRLIKSCLRKLKAYTFELRMLWRTVYLLFLYFEERRDPKLSPMVAEVLFFIAYESYYAHFMFLPFNADRVLSISGSPMRYFTSNIVLNLMRRPYSIPTNVSRPERDIVWNSVMMDSEKFLPLLLRQGVIYVPPSSHVEGWYYCVRVLKSICLLEKIKQDFVPEELSAVLDRGIPGVRQRIFTVFRAMDVVLRKFLTLGHITMLLEGGVIRNYHERYCKVFDTIPEPIVTIQEVKNILIAIYDVTHAEAIDNFCSKFQMIMPESDTYIAPRRLVCWLYCREGKREYDVVL